MRFRSCELFPLAVVLGFVRALRSSRCWRCLGGPISGGGTAARTRLRHVAARGNLNASGRPIRAACMRSTRIQLVGGKLQLGAHHGVAGVAYGHEAPRRPAAVGVPIALQDADIARSADLAVVPAGPGREPALTTATRNRRRQPGIEPVAGGSFTAVDRPIPAFSMAKRLLSLLAGTLPTFLIRPINRLGKPGHARPLAGAG